jgi:phage terminase small subunit
MAKAKAPLPAVVEKARAVVAAVVVPDGMTSRQVKFAYAFAKCGHGTDAAEEAGYEGEYNSLASMASNLLRNPKVRSVIHQLTEQSQTEAVMSRQERIEWLSRLVRGTDLELNADVDQRLKAADMLAKMNADYIERVEVEHVHYVTEVPSRVESSKEWAKTVEAEVVKERKK